MSFPKPTRRASKRARAAVKRRVVYAAVTARDICCRCCGRTYGLHRHHIVFRSQLGPTTTENVVLVCVACHEDIHARRLRVVGLDANQPLTFSMEGLHALDVSAVAHV
jgi:hypothetical protein